MSCRKVWSSSLLHLTAVDTYKIYGIIIKKSNGRRLYGFDDDIDG